MVVGIIAAAGRGLRMAAGQRKQYIDLEGLSILSRTVLAIESCRVVDRIVLVIPHEDYDYCNQTVVSPLRSKKEILMVAGGVERQDSVYRGLEAVGAATEIVVIHDGVRPFVTTEAIEATIDGAREFGACVQAVPVQDTLKTIDGNRRIEKTLSRDRVWMVQTPQAFRYDLIKTAHEEARKADVIGTDDAFLLERIGEPVRIAEGSRLNIKITTDEDLEMARAIVKMGSNV